MSTTLTVTETLRSEAQALTSQLPPDEHLHLQVVAPQHEPVQLPSNLSDFLRRAVEAVAAGGTVTFQALPAVVSTTVAAEMLGISRPTLMKLVRDNTIRSHKVGTHTRLRSEDVIGFRIERSDQQKAAFEAMRAVEEDLGLED